jgi:hypothetical protein
MLNPVKIKAEIEDRCYRLSGDVPVQVAPEVSWKFGDVVRITVTTTTAKGRTSILAVYPWLMYATSTDVTARIHHRMEG